MRKTVLLILVLSASCMIFRGTAKNDFSDVVLPSVLKKLQPPVRVFSVVPPKGGVVVGAKKTTVIFPSDAFVLPASYKKGDSVKVSLQELTTPMDFFTTSPPLFYRDKGKLALFESAGMFSLTAVYKGKKLRLAAGKKVKVRFPNIRPGKKFRVYYWDGKKWKDHGHNQERILSDTKNISRVREYNIDRFAWWNFDFPNQRLAAVKGSIRFPRNKKIERVVVMLVGQDFLGGSRILMKPDKTFAITGIQEKLVKLVAVSDSGLIGQSKPFQMFPRYGRASLPASDNNYIHDYGEIRLEQISQTVLTTPSALTKRLNLLKVRGFADKIMNKQRFGTPQRYAIIHSFIGLTEYRFRKTNPWIKMVSRMIIRPGGWIRTQKGGYLRFSLFGGRSNVRIRGRSLFRLTELRFGEDWHKGEIVLLRGNLEYVVNISDLDERTLIRVKTPHITVFNNGGRVFVRVDQDGKVTRVKSMVEGTLVKLAGKTGKIIKLNKWGEERTFR